MKEFIALYILCFGSKLVGQVYPTFEEERLVTINGYTLDAMEPYLSCDGNALFFNNLNDGITTSLHYASKINDSVFNYIGLVPVVNQTITPRLNAVASIDSANNFYWVSTRDYPTYLENLYRIRFLNNGYTNYGKVHGDFYINQPGYLIMDAAINYYGNQLIYCNAYFNNCSGLPCKASMGIASKVNDSTFNKLVNTSLLMSNINDTTNYLVYAPTITKDGLELYYTRLLKGGTQTEIVVSVRTNISNVFSPPSVLVTAPSVVPEGPTLTSDKTKLYYHKKAGTLFKIFYKKRSITTSLSKFFIQKSISVYPNPTANFITLNREDLTGNFSLEIYSLLGELLISSNAQTQVDLSNLTNGVYILKLIQDNFIFTKKIVKN